MAKRRYTIGLFISHLENDFSSGIAQGAILAAKNLDANLIIFPGRHIDGVYDDTKRAWYEYQYNTIYSYANTPNIDLILIDAGTIGCFISDEKLLAFLDSFKNIPILTIARAVEGYPSIMFDNVVGLKCEIEHIIKEHNRKKIGFVSGPSTNLDAIERLETYKNTLEENGIEFDPKLVADGDFTDHSTAAVRKLLDDNPDIDAIVFANDRMAIGGYKVLKERRLRIGKDICCAGFDDSPTAIALSPMLTTVRADSSELGYRAVELGISYVESGEIEQTSTVDTNVVLRGSCGCKSFASMSVSAESGMFNHILKQKNPQLAALEISDFLFADFENNIFVTPVIEATFDFIYLFLEKASDETVTDFKTDELVQKFRAMLDAGVLNFISFIELDNILSLVRDKAISETDDPKRKEAICDIFVHLYSVIANASITRSYNDKKEVKYNTWLTNSILNGMLLYYKDESRCYYELIFTLSKMNIMSSYVYTHINPVVLFKDDVWKRPEALNLRAYHNCDELAVLKGNDRVMPSDQLFSHKYMPDRRVTLVCSPLFSNEEHYGVLFCEMEYDYFYYNYAINTQLSSALKLIHMLENQAIIQKKLEESLNQIKSNNIILSQISRSDELTGVYNRRGFLEITQQSICDPLNRGKKALLIFADMDNLKVINDCFGHDDGDFALRTVAKILRECVRSTDAVGRIGGDEFAAFALINRTDYTTTFRQRLNDISKSINDACDKPYYVNMSVGILEFTCRENIDLQELLHKADVLLYSDKKNKRKSVLKTDDQSDYERHIELSSCQLKKDLTISAPTETDEVKES